MSMATSQISAPVVDADADDDAQQSLVLMGLLHVLLRYLWLILLVALLAGLAAWFLVRRLPDLYQSTASIEVLTQDAKAITIREDLTARNPEVLETTIQDFKNRSLMERINKALNLANDPVFLGGHVHQPASDDTVINQLLGGTTAELRPRTRLVDVSFVHQDPTVAQNITNALIEQFLEQGVEQRMKTLEVQNSVLVQKSQELKLKVLKSEQALQDYKKSLNSGSLESVSVEEGRNYVEGKLKDLNNDLTTTKGERLGLESDIELVKRAGNNPQRLLGIPSITKDPQVTAAQTQLSKVQDDAAALTQRYRDKHPRILEMRAQIQNAQNSLSQAALTAPTRIESRYVAVQAKEANLQEAVAAQEKALLGLEDRIIPFRVLQREYESDRALFESVLQRLKESTLSLGVQSNPLRVVQAAVPARRLANRRLFLVVGAAMGGACLVAGIIAGLYFLNTTIQTVDMAERQLGLPVLTAVPKMTATRTPSELLALLHRPNTPAAESFRTLRCALTLLKPKHEHQVVLFTSAVPGEGKSLTAANTAVAFAQQGLSTLLMEADLRRPSLTSKLLGTDAKLPGLGDHRPGEPLPITTTPVPNLSLLTAGAHVPNPAELLANAEFEKLIRSLKERFDRVVIDTAPLNVVSDTLSIVSFVSSVCLVVRSNSTSRKTVLRAVELLRRSGIKPDGIVLNGMPPWQGIDNHYDYSARVMYGGAETYGDSYATTSHANNGNGENGSRAGGASAPAEEEVLTRR